MRSMTTAFISQPGVGYQALVASNLFEEGQTPSRLVELVRVS